MGVYPILGVLGAQPERMVWVMMRKMVDDGEVAKMHGFLRKHGVKKIYLHIHSTARYQGHGAQYRDWPYQTTRTNKQQSQL